MINIKNKREEVIFKINQICSANVGILASGFNIIKNTSDMSKLVILSANMPNYSQYFFKQEKEVSYHIAGYDYNILNAIERMLGETVERYAAFNAYYLFEKESFMKASVLELSKQKYKSLALKYINVYSQKKYLEMHAINQHYADDKLKDNEEIEWFLCNSLLNEKTWIPSSIFFLSFTHSNSVTNSMEKKYYLPTSTGTATHINKEKAMYNAILESIQINEFNKYWYYGQQATELIIDDQALMHKLADLKNTAKITYKFFLHQKSYDIYTVSCYIFSFKKDYPAISYGIQASDSLEDAVIRSFMECLSVYSYNYFQFLQLPDQKLVFKNKDMKKDFMDLDKNVLFFSDPKNYEVFINEVNKKFSSYQKYSAIKQDFNDKSVSWKLTKILKQFHQNKIDMFYQDITPIEVSKWYTTVRVFIPEFTPVFIPSLPFDDHPSNKKIMTHFIHPLA